MSNTDSMSFAPDALVRGGTATTSSGAKPSLPTVQAADHIEGYAWGGRSSTAGLTITYAYRSEGTVPGTDATGFTPFSAAQIAAAEKALLAWSDVANVHFQRVDDGSGYSNGATIELANFTTGSPAGFTYLPGSRAIGANDGDVWINGSLSYNKAPTVGNYGGQVLIHELGHALGLTHPGEYDASDSTAPTYANSAAYFEDSRQYTVMSYFDETSTGAQYGNAYSAVPLLDDITAIQKLYGANTTAFAGDTVYGFNSNSGREWFSATSATSKLIFAVWDANGKDTFDFSGYAGTQTIDLRAGDFSSVGGLHENVAIAYGVTIENALGGSGADQIVGNAAANLLNGNAGADTISGEGGADTIHGGTGNDQIDGGSGGDWLYGDDGDDRLLAAPGTSSDGDYFMGGAGADTVTGGGGNDHIYGNDLATTAGTTDGADSLSGGDGMDYIQGNAGADHIDGGAGADRLYGGADNDTIDGGADDDWLQGNKGADSLLGGTGNDTIHGGADNDTIVGGAGLDQLFGDAGSDRFVFGAADATFATSGGTAFATDHVGDFTDGLDLIQLPFHVAAVFSATEATAAAAYATATGLLAGHALDVAAIGVGSDTILFYHADGTAGVPDSAITLDHVAVGAIGVTDFV